MTATTPNGEPDFRLDEMRMRVGRLIVEPEEIVTPQTTNAARTPRAPEPQTREPRVRQEDVTFWRLLGVVIIAIATVWVLSNIHLRISYVPPPWDVIGRFLTGQQAGTPLGGWRTDINSPLGPEWRDVTGR